MGGMGRKLIFPFLAAFPHDKSGDQQQGWCEASDDLQDSRRRSSNGAGVQWIKRVENPSTERRGQGVFNLDYVA